MRAPLSITMRHLGVFSLNDQMDFKVMLESFINTRIPMPPSEAWANAGMV